MHITHNLAEQLPPPHMTPWTTLLIDMKSINVQNSLLLVPVLNQINPIHSVPFYYSMINFSFIFHPHLRIFPLFFHQHFACISHLSHACYMPPQTTTTWSYFMVKSPNYKAPYAITSTLLDVITVLNILSWNTFNLCSTLGVTYQGIHP
jgi:hypothetical protein